MYSCKEIAKGLLELGCIVFRPNEPFRYASGLLGPIYCDNRLVISDVKFRRIVLSGMRDLCQNYFSEVNTIAGLATAGIPYASWLAEQMNLPLIYIRGANKGHGRKNLVEGRVQTGNHTLIVEDLVNQGKSSFDGITQAKEEGVNAQGLISIVDYEMPMAKSRFSQLGLPFHSLTNISLLLETALNEKVLTSEEVKLVEGWQRDPEAWSRNFS